jgi:hypothetical protein
MLKNEAVEISNYLNLACILGYVDSLCAWGNNTVGSGWPFPKGRINLKVVPG